MLNPRITSALQFRINVLAKRTFELSTFSLSHQDVLNLFAPAEHRKALADFPKIAKRHWGNNFEVRLDQATVQVVMNNHDDSAEYPASPKYPALQEDAPCELVERLNAWVTKRTEQGYDFGRAKLVLDTVSNFNLSQARFMWPCIRTLCGVRGVSDGEDERLVEFAGKMSDCPIPSVIPAVTPQMRKAMRQTSGLITATSMLEPSAGDVEVRPAVLTLSTEGNKRQEAGVGEVVAR